MPSSVSNRSVPVPPMLVMVIVSDLAGSPRWTLPNATVSSGETTNAPALRDGSRNTARISVAARSVTSHTGVASQCAQMSEPESQASLCQCTNTYPESAVAVSSTAVPALIRPMAAERSRTENHSATALVAAGNPPPSPMPSRKRLTASIANPVARP